MVLESAHTIAADHPALAGHFPGNPLVPAVVILDEVAAALAGHLGAFRLTGFPVAKFLAPLRPDQPFAIAFTPLGCDRYAFTCSIGDKVLARGEIAIAA